MLTVGSLFAGIGGFDLGLERAGMRSVWQCEIDPYCQRVLAKHWPDVLRVPDVRDVRADTVPAVDVICGGFPCQDISYAGLGAGLAGERSGLWTEMLRVIRDLRPRWVVVENVSALLVRGVDVVLGGLAAIGYDAEWDCLRASDFGAPHLRDRIWIVAYPNADSGRRQGKLQPHSRAPRPEHCASLGDHLDRLRAHVPDTSSGDGPARRGLGASRERRSPVAVGGLPSDGLAELWSPENPWAAGEPDVERMAHGLPAQVDRLHAVGNALVPQIAEWIGRRIVDYEEGELANVA